MELVVFPETFLSGYPFWVMLGGGGLIGDAEHARAYADYLEAARDAIVRHCKAISLSDAIREAATDAIGHPCR